MYLLDANVFMEASRFYYAFDLAPGFWNWLADTDVGLQAHSVRAVRDEITRGAGDLVEWAQALPPTFWREDTEEVVTAVREVVTWANDGGRIFKQAAIETFMSSADLWLIAHALAAGDVVVTREKPEPESRKAIKIPDVCTAFKVDWVDPFQAYRQLGMRLG